MKKSQDNKSKKGMKGNVFTKIKKLFGYYLIVLDKYAVFSGRAQRAEYWYFYLFNAIISFVLLFIDRIVGTYDPVSHYGLLSGLYTLAVLLPGIAVTIRRLHDVGKSGWIYLIGLIPFIGPIWLFVLLVSDSQPGDNKYGSNPKGVQQSFLDLEEEIKKIRKIIQESEE